MPIILSYNVRWNSDKLQIKNILNNINNVLNTYDIDFMLFQEAYFYKNIKTKHVTITTMLST